MLSEGYTLDTSTRNVRSHMQKRKRIALKEKQLVPTELWCSESPVQKPNGTEPQKKANIFEVAPLRNSRDGVEAANRGVHVPHSRPNDLHLHVRREYLNV